MIKSDLTDPGFEKRTPPAPDFKGQEAELEDGPSPEEQQPLCSAVEAALHRFLRMVDEEPLNDLHDVVMSEVETSLLQAVMRHTGNNQSRASQILGINRGTLRNKLKLYNLL